MKTYTSESGRCVLEVDPTDLYGRGPGRYTLVVDGREIWSATRPFTFSDAVVTSDGTAIGYAYQHGERGFAREGGLSKGPGDLHVAILDPSGGLRLNQVTQREESLYLHSSPDPSVNGIILHEDADLFTIRAGSGGEESWWTYRISDGKALQRFPLRGPVQSRGAAAFVRAAKPIPALPLSLVHALLRDPENGHSRPVVMLLDPDGKSVWHHDLQAGSPAPDDDAQGQTGVILDLLSNGRFEVWSKATSQAVTFQVSRDDAAEAGWRVAELGRRPYVPATKEEEIAPTLQRPLKSLGSFNLVAKVPTSPTAHIRGFEFDANGRIGVMRWESTGRTYTFALLDSKGQLIAEVPVPPLSDARNDMQARAASVGNDRWIIIASDTAGEKPSQGRWFDSETKTLSDAFVIDCPDIDALTGTGDGGFVALGSRRLPSTIVDELHAIDAKGRNRWKHSEHGYDGGDASLLSPEDVTVVASGEVAVLDNIRNAVQFFDQSGQYRRTVSLEKAWGREPNYPSGIMPDYDGGFIVYDFDGAQRFVRMDKAGKVREPLQPRYQDGRQVDAQVIRTSPDGRLWTTDSHALLRLDDKGIVDAVIGTLPDNDVLDRIAAVAGDDHGQLYAVDERTGAVHVFNDDGLRVRVCNPATDDFPDRLHSPSITVTSDGGVYLSGNMTAAPTRYLYFKPDGTRQGLRELSLGDTREEWFTQTGTDNLLVLGYQTAFLVDAAGKVLSKIERRSDRHWIDYAAGAAVSNDGSFAILSKSTADYGGRSMLALYTKDGTPVHTLGLPNEFLILTGYNSSHVVLRTEQGLSIYDRRGVLTHRFTPTGTGDHWGGFLTNGGRELWITDFPSRTVHRYEMP